MNQKKSIKKLIAFILTGAIMLSMFVSPAYARENNDSRLITSTIFTDGQEVNQTEGELETGINETDIEEKETESNSEEEFIEDFIITEDIESDVTAEIAMTTFQFSPTSPVTTYAELQNAIDIAADGDTILLSAALNTQQLTTHLTISTAKNITLKAETDPVTILAPEGKRHMEINIGDITVTLTFEDVIFQGAADSGGLYLEGASAGYYSDSQVNLNNLVMQNCDADNGGGIYADNLIVYIKDGKISGNKAINGGGIYGAEAYISVEGGEVSGNHAHNGGGLYLTNYSELMISDDAVIGSMNPGGGNTAEIYGGGIYLDSTFAGNDAYITGNEVTALNTNGGGGGVYVTNNSNFILYSNGIISNNTAKDNGTYIANGGGIMLDVPPDKDDVNCFSVYGKIADNTTTKGNGGGVMVNGSGEIYLFNGCTIEKNTALDPVNGNGGGIFIGNETNYVFSVYMYDGEIAENEAVRGGGIYIDGTGTDDNSRIEITGGALRNNTAIDGGGIYVNNFDYLFTDKTLPPARALITYSLPTGSEIRDNDAKENGGGIYAKESTVILRSSSVQQNTAGKNGGGSYLESSKLYLNNVAYVDNGSAINGGGIYLAEKSEMTLKLFDENFEIKYGETYFLQNEAKNEGGAIYTEAFNDYNSLTAADYGNIDLDSDTVFEGNTAFMLFTPPANGATTYPHLGFATTSGGEHILNNYDLNYVERTQLPQYAVTYNANGGTGSMADPNSPYYLGDTVTLLANGFSRSDYTFQHWNDKSDDSGTQYSVGSTFKITADITLYAIWKQNETTTNPGGGGGGGGSINNYTVIYQGNGGVRPNNTTEYRTRVNVGTKHIVLSNSNSNLQFAQEDYTFLGWSTDPNGPVNINIGDEITGNRDEVITIYAVWEERLLQLNRDDHNWYITGYPDNTVRPERQLTRAEAASIFFRLTVAGDKDTLYTANYPDMNREDWFYNYVAYLSHHGILVGYEDGTFRPDAPITRAELATLSSKFDALSLNTHNNFTDVSDSHWAAVYIASASQKGWITGYPDGTFKPNQNITRAETSSLINRVLDRSILSEDLPQDIKQYSDISESHWAYCDLMEASHSHNYERKEENKIDEIWLNHSHN